MVNYDLLSLLEKVLGKGRKTSGNNYSFFSPFVTHYKPKLEIDLTTNNKGDNPWHCWVSNEKGRSVLSLFKKIRTSKNYYDELYKILNVRRFYVEENNTNEYEVLALPKEFVKLSDYSKIKDRLLKKELAQAINYLKGRGLKKVDLLRYEIGYCSTGKYSGRIVIPSYDENYVLNYFVTRTIFDDDLYKHKNPKVSKDIIGFESFINWNEPITLVEGAFDAITARFNAIPLFGKILPNALKEKILLRRPPKIIIALDSDAKSSSTKIAQFLLSEGIESSIVELNKKDVNEMGFDNFLNAKLNSSVMDSYDIIKYKVLYG